MLFVPGWLLVAFCVLCFWGGYGWTYIYYDVRFGVWNHKNGREWGSRPWKDK